MQNLQTKNVITQMRMMPPITPPAIGPAGFDPLPELLGLPPTFSHLVVGQLSHPPPKREHTSSEAQTGHGGGSFGQTAQRLRSLG